MPAVVLPHECVITGYAEMTLEAPIVGYARHMEHRLTQLVA